MKKKVLLSSIATIALCLCLIAGSTFALFTSTSKVDISVTAGEVKMTASITDLTLWSVDADEAKGDETDVIDENGHRYGYADMTAADKFANGGTAAFDGAVLTMDKITPGDKVEFKVTGSNESNVAIQYRYVIECTEGYKLMSGLVVTVNGVAYESLDSYTSAWADLAVGSDIDPVEISIELPVTAGNEYQKQETNIKVTVEAVQGNAVTEGDVEVTYLAADTAEIQNLIASGESEIALADDMDLSGLNGIIAGTGIDVAEGEELVINGNGKTITVGHTAFNNSTGLEGLKGNTSIKFVNVVFAAENAGAGYAVCTGFDFTGTIEFENCTFKDLYAAIYMNQNSSGTKSTLVIKDCVYENTTWGYGVDTYTSKQAGNMIAYDQQVDVTFSGNDGLADEKIRENTWEQ